MRYHKQKGRRRRFKTKPRPTTHHETKSKSGSHTLSDEVADEVSIPGNHYPDNKRPSLLRLIIVDDHYYCYLLQSTTTQKTYVGITNKLKRRLRQHNGEISGGAASTKYGRPWIMVAYISGFLDKIEALRFEWRSHHTKMRGKGLHRRIAIFSKVIDDAKWVTIPLEYRRHLVCVWLVSGYRLMLPGKSRCDCYQMVNE